MKVTMTPSVREIRVLKSVTHDAPSDGIVLRQDSPYTFHVTATGTGNLAGETWLDGPAVVGRTALHYDPNRDQYVASITLSPPQVPAGDYDVKAVLEAGGKPVTDEVTAVEPVSVSLGELPLAFPVELKGEIEAFSAYFDTDDDRLRGDDRRTIEEYAAKLERFAAEIGSIRVTGHCDIRGTEIWNEELAERRAATVADLLADRLPGVSIETEGLGSVDPDPPGNNPDDWQKNRWARILIDWK